MRLTQSIENHNKNGVLKFLGSKGAFCRKGRRDQLSQGKSKKAKVKQWDRRPAWPLKHFGGGRKHPPLKIILFPPHCANRTNPKSRVLRDNVSGRNSSQGITKFCRFRLSRNTSHPKSKKSYFAGGERWSCVYAFLYPLAAVRKACGPVIQDGPLAPSNYPSF